MVRIENRILSPTAVNTYLSCPHKFYLRYIKKLRSKPSINLIRGMIVHNTLHEFNKNQPQVFKGLPPKMTSYELILRFNTQWEKAKDSLNALGLTDEELNSYYEDSKEMINNFCTWFYKEDSAPAAFSEVRLFSKNLGLMGIIDAVHKHGETVTLVDYKTSKHAKITDDILRQAAIYALLYQDRFQVVPDSVAIHFLKEKDDPMPVYVDEPLLEYGHILVESIREKTKSSLEKDYPCTCGGYCERDFSGG